jgi:RNA polymerase sigma-70 factor (ECF subfamily)
MPTTRTDPSEVPPRDDASLIERIAARESQALAELYDQYSSLLLSLARRILRNTQTAEEVLQEVFLQIWNQAHRYDTSRSSVSTWLVLMTRSRAIDRLRSRQSRERTLDTLELEGPPSYESAQAWRNVLREERRERLLRELGTLPPEQKQVLDLAFYGGQSQTEIAAFLGIPLGTVKTRTLLAMRKLRKALAEDLGELL